MHCFSMILGHDCRSPELRTPHYKSLVAQVVSVLEGFHCITIQEVHTYTPIATHADEIKINESLFLFSKYRCRQEQCLYAKVANYSTVCIQLNICYYMSLRMYRSSNYFM